jgi:large subunit ribosomal protein L31
MNTEIHPNYYITQVRCACGNQFITRSTQKEIKLEICGGCHPFYTGKQRLVDTAGRVERFQKRFAKTEGKTVTRRPKAKVKKRIVSQADKTKRLSTAPTKDAEDKKAGKKTAKKADKKA